MELRVAFLRRGTSRRDLLQSFNEKIHIFLDGAMTFFYDDTGGYISR